MENIDYFDQYKNNEIISKYKCMYEDQIYYYNHYSKYKKINEKILKDEMELKRIYKHHKIEDIEFTLYTKYIKGLSAFKTPKNVILDTAKKRITEKLNGEKSILDDLNNILDKEREYKYKLFDFINGDYKIHKDTLESLKSIISSTNYRMWQYKDLLEIDLPKLEYYYHEVEESKKNVQCLTEIFELKYPLSYFTKEYPEFFINIKKQGIQKYIKNLKKECNDISYLLKERYLEKDIKEISSRYVHAYLIMKGWKWKVYSNEYGYLVSPEGNKYFQYDSRCKRYRYLDSHDYMHFEDLFFDMESYYSWAERIVMKKILNISFCDNKEEGSECL